MRWSWAVPVAALLCNALARAEEPTLRLQDVPLTIGTPRENPERVPGLSGSGKDILIRVGRIWRKGEKTHASVNLRNVASSEFHDITLRCTAFDVHSQAIDTRQADLTREHYGALKPGFDTDLDFVFETPRTEVRSLSCDARAHGLPHRVD